MNKEEAARILPFIQALAEGKAVEWKWVTAEKWYPIERGFEHVIGDSNIELRIKPDTRWYRVALMQYVQPNTPCPASAGNESEEEELLKDPDFIRWLTPRIEYEV